MKKNKTGEKTIEKAIELFNEKGVEYIGMRELAASLGLRLGNITYYFPTKDALVNEISLRYSALNEQIIKPVPGIRPRELMAMLEESFHLQFQYRCIPLSLSHLLEQNPLIAARYKTIQQERTSTIAFNLKHLQEGKWLQFEDDRELEFLNANIVLIARFWISDARIAQRHLGMQRRISTYLEMIARLLLKYASTKGKKEIREWLSE